MKRLICFTALEDNQILILSVFNYCDASRWVLQRCANLSEQCTVVIRYSLMELLLPTLELKTQNSMAV